MQTISAQQLQFALLHASQQIIQSEPYLTKIDTIIGDGDHGTGMKLGFTGLKKLLEQAHYDTPYALLYASGLELVKIMGGASGVLFGTLLIGGLDTIKDKPALTAFDLAAFFEKSVAAIMKRGRTAPGDKTMVDALVPAAQAMQTAAQAGATPANTLLAAAQGAKQGVENTKNMLPRAGRSKNFRDKALGHPDPGAISVSILFQGLYDGTTLYTSKETN